MKLAAFVFSSIALTIQYYADQYKNEDLKSTLEDLKANNGLPKIETYDYIVVGGGTGGCVVAGRLSEKFKVLLLEAGGYPVPMVDVPYFANPVANNPDINYFFESVPQKNASLGNSGIVSVKTGKMLGGSGSHNDMVYNRGSPHDYDNYASILGDESWSYLNVLQYFKKSENYVGKLFNEGEEDYYGKNGPLTVETDLPLFLDKWFAAGTELGYKTGDANGYQKESFTPMGKLIYEGKRVTTYNRYIKPFIDTRDNLTVIPYALASQILIDDNNKAYGVAFSRHGIPQIAHASKEVIVSTGSFVSPILLMLSGVGPAGVLQEANIPLKINLPGVGQNLRDHVAVYLSPIKFNATARPYFPRVTEAEFEEKLKEYVNSGVGEFGNFQEGNTQALLVSSRAAAEGETEWPDARITFGPRLALEDFEDTTAFFWVTLDRPKSSGFITLNTTAYRNGVTDLTKLALIDFKMLEEPSDVEVILEHMKISLKVIEETNAFKEIGASFDGSSDPACTQFQFRSDDYWRCHIMQRSESAIHMVGSCSMGVGMNSVTDSKFKVKGVSNLRVVDASVLPLTPNANLNLAVIMLAEKASDEILASAI